MFLLVLRSLGTSLLQPAFGKERSVRTCPLVVFDEWRLIEECVSQLASLRQPQNIGCMPRFGKYRGRNLLLLLYRVLQRSLGCQQKAVELSWLLASLALVCIPASLHVPARMAPNCPDSVANEADVSYVDRNGLAGGWVLELVDNVENCSLLLYLFGVSAEFGLNGCAYPENRWLKLPPGTGLHSKQKSSARL